MFDVHSPNWVLSFFVDGDKIIDNIGFESAILIENNMVEAIILIILSDEETFVVHGSHEVNFSEEIRHLACILDFESGLFLIWEERKPITSRVEFQQSFKDNFSVIGVKVLNILIGDIPFWIFEDCFNEVVDESEIILPSVMYFSVAVSLLMPNIFLFDEFCFAVVIELQVEDVFVDDTAVPHVKILIWEFKNNKNYSNIGLVH